MVENFSILPIFLDFFKIIFEKKLLFEMFQYTQTTFTPPIIFGVFSDPEQFLFSQQLLPKKKYAPSQVFFHKISPNWPIRQAETTVPERDGAISSEEVTVCNFQLDYRGCRSRLMCSSKGYILHDTENSPNLTMK